MILLFKRVRKSIPQDAWFSRPATILFGLLFVQIGLGIYTWQEPMILNATAHVAVGALLLATSSVLSLESFRRLSV